MGSLTRDQVIAHRIAASQLDRPRSPRPITDAAIFDIGVQDSGRDGASWALANRGVPVDGPEELADSAAVALVWTLRASPHFYRRADLPAVMVATSPFSTADAAKRVIGADKPLRAAGIDVRAGLAEVARQLREVVDVPRVKGEVSTLLTKRLSDPYLRSCVPCGTTHSWEVPFRLGALYAGLELVPGTSPPVLRRIPEWPEQEWGPAPDPTAAPERLQPIRNYLRFLGPATVNDVAGFLDAPVAEVKKHLPADAVEVEVGGNRAWSLQMSGAAGDPDLVRLLGPFDLLLQGRDRALLVPDRARHKELWPALGRPGAVLTGTTIAGVWRPRASGGSLSVTISWWGQPSRAARSAVEQHAEALASHRGLALRSVDG